VVDYGRTYLGFMFNLYLAGARFGGYYGDMELVRKYSPKVLETMDDIARLCSAHEEFRLETYYSRSERFAPMYPNEPDANTRNIFITFTILSYDINNRNLLDYMAEDWCEMIVNYYRKTIKAYLENLEELVAGGGKLSGRLTEDDLVTEMPNRCNDFAPAKGKIKWSAFGVPGEPELIKGLQDIRIKLISGETIRDPEMRYDGPITSLFAELMQKYPVTEEVDKLLDRDPVISLSDEDDTDPVIEIAVGEEISGINKGLIVDEYDIDKEVLGLFDCSVISKEYNISRGNVQRVRVRATDFMKFKRLEDTDTVDGTGKMKQFTFQFMDDTYILLFFEGSDVQPASVSVRKGNV